MLNLMTPLEGEHHRLIREDGTALHTIHLGGSGSTVVLAHGFGFTSGEWNIVAPLLAERGHRVIAFDQRGHGASSIGRDGLSAATMASDYAAILAHYDLRDVALVGHSMGGFLAIQFLLDHVAVARRVRRLGLIATFAGDVARKSLQNRMQIPLFKSGVLSRMLKWRPVANYFTRKLTGEGFTPAFTEAFLREFMGNNHAALVPIIADMVNINRYDELGEIRIPAVIIVGEHDRTSPPFHATALHEGLAHSRRVTLKGCGHLLNWEAPDGLVAELAALIA